MPQSTCVVWKSGSQSVIMPDQPGRIAPGGRSAFLLRRLLEAVLARAGERFARVFVAAEPGAFLGLRKADPLQDRCPAREPDNAANAGKNAERNHRIAAI